jgi:small subunit ribosomal protein S3
MASRIADALQRGIHFRRTGFWALNQIMKAGALGAEIVVRGKLTSQRHRYEKYKEGYIIRSGDPAIKSVRTAVTSIQLKQGLIGIRLKIIAPGAVFPDRIHITKGIEVEEGEPSPSPTEGQAPNTSEKGTVPEMKEESEEQDDSPKGEA